MALTLSSHRDRAGSAMAALGVIALVGWGLISGLSVSFPRMVDESLQIFDVPPESPPPPPEPIPEPQPPADPRLEGAASPPNLKSKATELVAPPPIIQPPTPPPIVVAPIASTETQASSGAADIQGPGTGSGGTGNGTGSGSGGNGDGGGGGGESPPRQIGGRISDRDYPRALAELGVSGTVSVRYAVEVDGHVDDCAITHSSGSRELDVQTCEMIERRFRFRPSLDRRGNPVRSYIVEDHDWEIENRPRRRR